MNQFSPKARFDFQSTDSPRGEASAAAETTPWVTDYANRHALLFRFIALNMGVFALLAAAWGQGWLQLVIEADSTGLTFIIVAVFATGFILCGQRVWWLNGELALLAGAEAVPGSLVTDYLGKTAGHDSSSRQLSASAAKLRITANISIVHHLANSLVLLGLIGALFYHLANGIRHLAWDVGWGYEMGKLKASGWVVVVFAGAMTVPTGPLGARP